MSWQSADDARDALDKVNAEIGIIDDLAKMLPSLPIHYTRRLAVLREQQASILLWLLVNEMQHGK